MQATSKDSDQTAHMRRLILGFAGRTYHIVGNLMLRLNCVIPHILMAISSIRWDSTFAQSCINIAPVTCSLSHGQYSQSVHCMLFCQMAFSYFSHLQFLFIWDELIYKNYVVCWKRYFILSFYVDKYSVSERGFA